MSITTTSSAISKGVSLNFSKLNCNKISTTVSYLVHQSKIRVFFQIVKLIQNVSITFLYLTLESCDNVDMTTAVAGSRHKECTVRPRLGLEMSQTKFGVIYNHIMTA